MVNPGEGVANEGLDDIGFVFDHGDGDKFHRDSLTAGAD